MGELESIRDIARRLVAEFRRKKTIPTVQQFVDETPCIEKLTNIAVAEETVFEGVDQEWLRKLGIEA